MLKKIFISLCVFSLIPFSLSSDVYAKKKKSAKVKGGGEVSEEIKCKKNGEYSYYIYTPSDYDPERKYKYPVMFIMSAGGGKSRVLKRYMLGADKNKMVLAVSVQSSNKCENNYQAIDTMMEDVLDKFPVDPKRCYTTGMSGGGREAFSVVKRYKKLAGILPCGAGDTDTSAKIPIYGACGTNCFNRRDMSITFYKTLKRKCILKFFVGNHTWANSEIIAEGMTWLNGNYVLTKTLSTSGKNERVDFCVMVMKMIEAQKESNPYAAYCWAEFLSTKAKNIKEAKQAKIVFKELQKNPKVVKSREAKRDLDSFVKKHLASPPYYPKEYPRKARKDAKKLAEKYSDTSFAEIFIKLQEPFMAPQ